MGSKSDITHCELIIRNGIVIDGTGAAPVRADVGVNLDRVVLIGDLSETGCAAEIDARGKVVAPGFIDVHTHDDRALLSNPDMAMKVSQGVTTVVVGNCGVSLAPLSPKKPVPPPMNLLGGEEWYRFPTVSAYAEELKKNPPAVNTAILVGHSTLRIGVMPDLERPASEMEIGHMQQQLREGMKAGAIGFSTGLAYPPASAASTNEVIALAQVAGKMGGLYATHMRDEHDGVEDSLDESFSIGRRACLPVIISHHKCAGRRNFGRSQDTLARIDNARTYQEIGLDVYPYDAGSSVLIPAFVEQSASVLITWSEPIPEAAGQSLEELSRSWGISRDDAIARLTPAGAIYFMMDEADVRRILVHPESMIGSDGLPHDDHPHPRLWGTFPRVLGHYVRELGILTLEAAVHKMTGLTAARLGLVDRGIIRTGAFADAVIFDPNVINDQSTYDNPIRSASGIDTVIVNGATIWRTGHSTGLRTGRVLKRNSC